jgi:hypothetical protein
MRMPLSVLRFLRALEFIENAHHLSDRAPLAFENEIIEDMLQEGETSLLCFAFDNSGLDDFDLLHWSIIDAANKTESLNNFHTRFHSSKYCMFTV